MAKAWFFSRQQSDCFRLHPPLQSIHHVKSVSASIESLKFLRNQEDYEIDPEACQCRSDHVRAGVPKSATAVPLLNPIRIRIDVIVN